MPRFLARHGWYWLIAAALVSLPSAAWAQIRSDVPKLIKVTDRVYCATGYALANVIYVITDESLVVIDTPESPAAAAATLEAMRKFTDKPIRRLIYTHFHGDHCNGARSFAADKPEIIAQALHVEEMGKYRALAMYNGRLNGLQFGFSLPPKERGISLAFEPGKLVIGYMPPTKTFDDKLEFEEGGVRFELRHAPGETNDHLYVWLPDERIACCGDLYYNSFPMLASPMKHERPVATWADSLQRIREHKPEHLVPSHSDPVSGAAVVDDVLDHYIAAIRFVDSEMIKYLNQGLSLAEIQRKLKLPPELAAKPYLQPLYGRVEWGVAGAYRNYTGWYDFNPTHLNPALPQEVHQALFEAAGGAEPLVARAQKAADDSNWQLVLEVTEIVRTVEPKNGAMNELRAQAFTELANRATSSVEKNIYRAAALEHRKQLKRAAAKP
ncbi:MAG: alkyl/aryl-sulfatase [Pirellulales bacterium]|nr:alkyl/aryl-sulfatase [Pirellulales bacterium]